jgi:phosphoglycerate dehydrogenase-like enzyme
VNDPDLAPLFDVSEAQFEQALRPHPSLRGRVRLTIGRGEEGLEAAMPTAEVIIAFRFPHARVAAKAPRLRWIHQTGAGIDHLLPLDWLPPGVILTNSRGVHGPRAADFVACALLMLNNLIPRHVTSQRAHRWDQVFNDPITGKTVVVIGVGMMGGVAARQARRLGLRVLGVRRSGRPHPAVHRMHRPGELARVLPQADFVLVTAPLTTETRHLLGREQLDLLKPSAGIVNMGRAGIIDTGALARKLTRGELSGAILDVFDPEPLPADSPLWDCPDLVMTPHVSSDALNYTERMLAIFADNCRRLLAGLPLRNRVRPDQQY